MFGVATQAGNLFRDAGGMMEVVAGVAFAAGAIHLREAEGVSAEVREGESSGCRARGPFDPISKAT